MYINDSQCGVRRVRCDKCDDKIPKYQTNFKCFICTQPKHWKCHGLNKSTVRDITNSYKTWVCVTCIEEILPVNAMDEESKHKSGKIKNSMSTKINKCKVKCAACPGYMYAKSNVKQCSLCSGSVHLKCWKDKLGCKACCEELIPGFNCYHHELNDISVKNSAIFNPYSSEHPIMQIGDLIDNAEECNPLWAGVSELLTSCEYKKPCKATNVSSNKHGLDILSLNIRSIYGNIEKLRENIDYFQKFDVICFNETNCIVEKLPNGIHDITLQGFHEPLVKNPIRSTGKGGGLVTYVNTRVCEEDSMVVLDHNPEAQETAGEFQFTKIKNCLALGKSIVIGNVYRSPSRNPEAFLTLFEKVLNLYNRHLKKLTYIVGDFNLDLLKFDSDNNCQKLINLTASLGMAELVSRPTRITDHSATLIDHAYTNSIDNTLSCNIVTLDISDHLAIHLKTIITKSIPLNERISRSKLEKGPDKGRVFNDANHAAFYNLIDSETWDDIDPDLSAQDQYDKFDVIISKHYNSAFPIKLNTNRRKNERVDPKPWILPWLENACERKQEFYLKFTKNNTIENKIKYERMKSFCKKHTEKAKSKYTIKMFEQHRGNSKKQWQIINGLLNRNNKKSGIKKLLDNTGSAISSPSKISEFMNDYFVTVAPKLKQNVHNSNLNNSNYLDNLPSPPLSSMFLSPTTPKEISDIISKLQNKCTMDMRVSAIKIADTTIRFSGLMSQLVNASFRDGIFPQQLKCARVIPIHKGGSRSTASNYRPISLLPCISKIFEKCMHARILDYMESNNLLYEGQYGFRPGRSCEHALLTAQNHLLNNLSNRKVSMLLLIDFSKAFDVIDSKILLEKLDRYGIRGLPKKWLTSYLTGRSQFVTVNGHDSSKQNLTYGVPQGSILGPLLFIIYINDMPALFESAKFILYADDANIIISGDHFEQVLEQFNKLTQELDSWVKNNGLILNLKKTNYMIFSTRRHTNTEIDVKINNVCIARKKEARFLGVIVDEQLNWGSHIRAVRSKMCRYIGVMYKIKNRITQRARLQIYHSFVQSHINYCSTVWGHASSTLIDSLFSQQKKGIRAVIPGFINYRYKDGETPGHTKPYFSEYKILNVHNLIALNSIMLTHKARYYKDALPSSVVDTISEDSPLRTSSHSDCLDWLSKYGKPTYKKSVFYKGPLLCTQENFPSPEDGNYSTFSWLKSALKRKLYELQITGPNDEWQPENSILKNIQGLRKSNRIRDCQ